MNATIYQSKVTTTKILYARKKRKRNRRRIKL